MHLKDKERLAAALERLCAAFGRPISHELLDAYCRALADVPIETVEWNAAQELKYGTRMPPPASLRAAIPGSSEPEARPQLEDGARRFSKAELLAIVEDVHGKVLAAGTQGGLPKGTSSIGAALLSALGELHHSERRRKEGR